MTISENTFSIIRIVLILVVMIIVNTFYVYRTKKILDQDIPNKQYIDTIRRNIQQSTENFDVLDDLQQDNIDDTIPKNPMWQDPQEGDNQEGNNQEQGSPESNNQEQNIQKQDESSTKQIVSCINTNDEFKQKDKQFTVAGTNLSQLQNSFKQLQLDKQICAQQFPIGTIIPIVYYPTNGGYEILYTDSTKSTLKPGQILLRTQDSLVLLPLLGGQLKKDVLLQTFNNNAKEPVFSILTWQKDNTIGEYYNIPNTVKKVLKQQTSVQESGNEGETTKSISKWNLFKHSIKSALTSASNSAVVYTEDLPKVEYKKSNAAAGSRSSCNTGYWVNLEKINYSDNISGSANQVVHIEDPSIKAIFCMVLGYL